MKFNLRNSFHLPVFVIYKFCNIFHAAAKLVDNVLSVVEELPPFGFGGH